MKQIAKYLVRKIGRGRLTFVILFIISTIISVYFNNHNDYMRYRMVSVTIKGHVIGRYNSLNLIAHSNQWGTFNIAVSPSTYHSLKNGDKASFKLREMDIRQTAKKNIIYFFGEGLLISFTIVMFLMIFLVNPIANLAKGLSSISTNNAMLKMPLLGFWTSV